MIDKEKYNEDLQEIIERLQENKIKEGDKMQEYNRVTILGGIWMNLEELTIRTQYEMAIAQCGVPSNLWRSQKQIDYEAYRKKEEEEYLKIMKR